MKRNNNKSNILEKYRILRNIIYKNRESGITCVSITSNSDNEGKEVIAKNLALILAKSGKKTLYLDCCLYEDKGARETTTNKSEGFINILKDMERKNIDGEKIREYIKNSIYENLSVTSLGDYGQDCFSSIIKTDYLKVIIEHLKQSFDYIIMDTPSFKNLSYTQVITDASDGCIFVIKEGAVEVDEGEAINAKLVTLTCKVLGCILNKSKKPIKIYEKTSKDFKREDKYSGLVKTEKVRTEAK